MDEVTIDLGKITQKIHIIILLTVETIMVIITVILVIREYNLSS